MIHPVILNISQFWNIYWKFVKIEVNLQFSVNATFHQPLLASSGEWTPGTSFQVTLRRGQSTVASLGSPGAGNLSRERRLWTSRRIRSQACDSWNRKPPLRFNVGFSTLSQIASFTPLSNHLLSLSRITTSLLLNECPVAFKSVNTADSGMAVKPVDLRCWYIRALSDCWVSPMYESWHSFCSHLIPYTTFRFLSLTGWSFTWTSSCLSVLCGLCEVEMPNRSKVRLSSYGAGLYVAGLSERLLLSSCVPRWPAK